MLTGLPTVLGWDYHVKQRGNPESEIEARRIAVKAHLFDRRHGDRGAAPEALPRRATSTSDGSSARRIRRRAS